MIEHRRMTPGRRLGERRVHMVDACEVPGSDDAAGLSHEDDDQRSSGALELAASTTLVEVTPGVAVVFGEVPDGLASHEEAEGRKSVPAHM